LKVLLEIKKFDLDITIINDGKKILNTGGGILNMMNSSNDSNFLILNPDTVWNQGYLEKIKVWKIFISLIKLKIYFYLSIKP